jgi:glyoxylate reductase
LILSAARPGAYHRAAAPKEAAHMAARVVITRPIPRAALEMLTQGLPGGELRVFDGPVNLAERAAGADALICTLADTVDAALLERLAPRLKVVATFAVGVNNIDLVAAARLGVAVCNTPDVLTDATAEVAVALILSCARRLGEGERLTRAGGFHGWAPLFHLGHAVTGRSLGIVGAGRIGRRVAEIMHRGFGCPILFHARSPRPDWEAELNARPLPLEELLTQADFVSLHCPLTPETRHLINARTLALMRGHAVLVNTARGPVVDEAALAEALRAGRLLAAGLDVYEHEPEIHPELMSLENVVLLPHLGSATVEAREEMGRMCANAVLDVLAGRAPAHRVA